MLNPTNPEAFLYENIKIYYLLDGIKKEINLANLDYSKSIMLNEINGEYQMRLFLNCTNLTENITYVQWNETDIDTFKTELKANTDNTIITKLWYNDSLVWNVYDFTPGNFRKRELTIIK